MRERKIPSGRTASLLIVLAKLEDEDEDEVEDEEWPLKGQLKDHAGIRAMNR